MSRPGGGYPPAASVRPPTALPRPCSQWPLPLSHSSNGRWPLLQPLLKTSFSPAPPGAPALPRFVLPTVLCSFQSSLRCTFSAAPLAG